MVLGRLIDVRDEGQYETSVWILDFTRKFDMSVSVPSHRRFNTNNAETHSSSATEFDFG